MALLSPGALVRGLAGPATPLSVTTVGQGPIGDTAEKGRYTEKDGEREREVERCRGGREERENEREREGVKQGEGKGGRERVRRRLSEGQREKERAREIKRARPDVVKSPRIPSRDCGQTLPLRATIELTTLRTAARARPHPDWRRRGRR